MAKTPRRKQLKPNDEPPLLPAWISRGRWNRKLYAETQAGRDAEIEAFNREWEARRERWRTDFGEELPINVDQWEVLLARVGLSPQEVCDVMAGIPDIDLVINHVEGYLQRVRMDARSGNSPVVLGGSQSSQGSDRIDRPDFVLTTDLRATSDDLWNLFAKFRRLLMAGERVTSTVWVPLLADIREKAHRAKLHAQAAETSCVCLTLKEMHLADPKGQWLTDENAGDKVVLVGAGESPTLWEFNTSIALLPRGEREVAIDWAEGWMRRIESMKCAPPGPPSEVVWVSAGDAARRSELDTSTISKRAKRERWTVNKPGRYINYSLADLERAWPDRNFRPRPSGK